MSPKPIEVRVSGDSQGAVVALNRTEREIRQLDQTAQKSSSGLGHLKSTLAGIGGAILAGGALKEGFGLIKEGIGLASDLTETVGKTDVIFGKSSKGIQAWAKTTDAALSMSQTAILDTVSGFDLLLKNQGISGKTAKDWSKNLTDLSADLSSFFNVSTQEAADALSSALKGENDPVEKFGITLNDATIKARAYAMGLYSGKGALTATAKAQATYAEILEQTDQAQGDLIRTQGSAANQMRQFDVNIQALKTTLGTAFTPLIEEYLPGINDWLKSINNEKAAEELGQKFLDFAHTIEGDVWPKLKQFGTDLKDAFKGVDTDALKTSIGSIGDAAENVAGGISAIFKAYTGLSPEAQKNIATIVAAGTALGVLAKHNPVIKIGVDLVAGAVGTIAESLIARMFRGTQNVHVLNWPSVYPDGADGGSGKPAKKGTQAALGLTALAAALAPLVIDKLPLSPFFKDRVAGIAEAVAIGSSAAWVATALGLSNPIGWVIGVSAGIAYLGKKYGDQEAALKNLSNYTTGGFAHNTAVNERQNIYAQALGVAQVKTDKGLKGLSTYTTGGFSTNRTEHIGMKRDYNGEPPLRRSGDAALDKRLDAHWNAIAALYRAGKGYGQNNPSIGTQPDRDRSARSSSAVVGTIVVETDPLLIGRVFKRGLEDYDISVGRAPGATLAKTW